MARVLVLGASGLIGGVLWERLAETHSVTGLDRRPDRARGVRRGDVRRPRSLGRAFEGVDAVVDLATGAAVDLPWEAVQRDMHGRVNVLEAARAHGVARYVFASSNHVTGMYEFEPPYSSIVAGAYAGIDAASVPLIAPDWPIRPDSAYGVGKAFGEAVARHYADRHGLSCICLRIGTVRADDRPADPRHFATLLTHRDLGRLVECTLEAPPELRFGIYYGVSANTWRFWNLTNAREELRFEPTDDAERFRTGSAQKPRGLP
ncbi:MAG: NAD-dependent epimerase/dehydratase family protein [Gaiellaceae bacterium]